MEHPQFRIDAIEWNKSLGLCWARSRIQRLYAGEDFTLQLDSHHRFVEHWDEKLITYMELAESSKPLLSSYVAGYAPATNVLDEGEPFKMVGQKFSRAGTIPFHPHRIDGWRDLHQPVKARFVSGHFFFTLGKHCEEYRYDPGLYFAGDEISLSIRSYTLGYDLFHPHRHVVWHEYTRKGRAKHWDDHVSSNQGVIDVPWHERDQISLRRLRKLLREEDNEEDLSIYDLGTVRTHRDYELYAGIDFARRRLHREAIRGDEPPCTYSCQESWENSFSSTYDVQVAWSTMDVDQCDDMQFLYLAVEDDSGAVIFRHDAAPDSAEATGVKDDMRVSITSSSPPARFVLWPYSASKGWMKKVEYKI